MRRVELSQGSRRHALSHDRRIEIAKQPRLRIESRGIGRLSRNLPAGTGHEDVDLAEALDGLLRQRPHRLAGEDVAADVVGPAPALANRLHHRFAGGAPAPVDDDDCALFGKLVRDTLADATACAGDDSDLAVQ